nr:immunoglobulin light chain junction region [Macaca mulatta]
CLQTRDSPFTF